MSIHTPALKRPRGTSESTGAAAARARAAGSIIVASVLVGAASAALLVLVAFPGATEAVTSGTVLLGFALGWTLMAVLPGGTTHHRQRWACVPAAVMGLTGAFLVVAAPGDRLMTALNWLWPPLFVTLAMWSLTRVRRSMTGMARWVLCAVVAVLILASVSATYGNISRALSGEPAAPGRLYDVGGHRLHLDCHGHGSPTVVLLNGLGGISAGWARISVPVAEATRTCAYDRAGQGWSDDADHPQDGLETAEDLRTLLAAASEQGPFVLVGHSTGGTAAMVFAARYPQQVAGMVLLDSSSPQQFSRLPAFSGQYSLMRRLYGVLPSLSRLGLGRLASAGAHLPAADADTVGAMTSAPRSYRSQRDEVSVLPQLFAQAQALTTLGDRPLAVLTASANSTGTDGWDGAQDQLASLSTDSVHRTVESTHLGLLEDTGPAAASTDAIRAVVASVRNATVPGFS